MATQSGPFVCGNCGNQSNRRVEPNSLEELSGKLQSFAKLSSETEFPIGPLEFLLHRCNDVDCKIFLQPFYEHQIFIIVDDETRGKSNNLKRKYFYRNVITSVWGEGVLGKRNRVKIPECIVFVIRTLAPATDNDLYMGYKSVRIVNDFFNITYF